MTTKKSILDNAFGMVKDGKLVAVQLSQNPIQIYGQTAQATFNVVDQEGETHERTLDDVFSPTLESGIIHPINLLQDEHGNTAVDEQGNVYLDPSKQFAQKVMGTLGLSSATHIPAASQHSAPAETAALRQGLE